MANVLWIMSKEFGVIVSILFEKYNNYHANINKLESWYFTNPPPILNSSS